MNTLEKIVEEIESMKNDAYETLKEERKRHGASKTAEELENYIYGLACAVDIVEKYVGKEECGMNVLEKILEEIEDHAIEFESFGMCDDYVSVGWAKDIIRSHMGDVPKCRECSRRKFYMQGYEDGKKNDGWIPVEERLPEDDDMRFYMCIVENHEEDLPMFCQYDSEYGFGFWHDIYDSTSLGFVDTVFETNDELGYEKVVAWQPLPKPMRKE